MLAVGRHYLKKQKQSTGIPERKIVETAIQSLGLNELTPFDPDEKIIEYRLAREEAARLLVNRSVRAFTDELSTDSPAPGGGSVAALCGAMAAGLAAMVANLTVGRKGHEKNWEAMIGLAERGQTAKDAYLQAVDADTDAFNAVMAAMRMSGKTDEERATKETAIREANRHATLVPLSVLERAPETLDLAEATAARGNPNSLSDAGVAGLAALASAEGAYYNVLINLGGMEADPWVEEIRTRARAGVEAVRKQAAALATAVEAKLNTP
jgi:glutamate formiminotransferase/formiminotetrahydrofolate cyclodeaminase